MSAFVLYFNVAVLLLVGGLFAFAAGVAGEDGKLKTARDGCALWFILTAAAFALLVAA